MLLLFWDCAGFPPFPRRPCPLAADLLLGDDNTFTELLWHVLSRVVVGDDGASLMLAHCNAILGGDVRDLGSAFRSG